MIETRPILYCCGYKYQLRCDVWIQTGIHPPADIVTELVELRRDGWMLVRKYFAWDGASGPTWDDRANMRASLVHDALYYLMRVGLLGIEHRPEADALLKMVMLADGALPIRARYYEAAVRLCGGRNACPGSAREVCEAP